ncbi:MAG: hypothetical protein ACREAB_01580 [Blastocatellia bacterium]
MNTISVATFGTIVGWVGGQMLALLLSVPPWFAQITLAVLISVSTVSATHFVKRWLNRRWPDRHRRNRDTDE